MLKNKNGFSVLEAVASVFIITLVITTALSIILTMRNQAIRTEEKIKAIDIGTLVRYDLEHDYSYDTLNVWMDGTTQDLTMSNCSTSPISCTIFDELTVDGKDYAPLITVTFLAPTAQSELYEIIKFEVHINYYKESVVTLEGTIYA